MKNIVYVLFMMSTINNTFGFNRVILHGAKELDGFFIKSKDIEYIYIFKKKVQELILSLEDIKFQIAEEDLQNIKQEIMHLAKDFFLHEPHAKPFINKLIEEECEKRNNQDSMLLEWCKIKHGHEIKAFDKLITSVNKLYAFTKDLVYFLEDIIESCPIAQEELKQKIKKWDFFKRVLEDAENKKIVQLNELDRHLFLQYVKYEKLCQMSFADCTTDYIVFLVDEFHAKQY